MATSTIAPIPRSSDPSAKRSERVDVRRLLWVGPLAVVASVGVNLLIRWILQTANPAYQRMGQLGNAMIALTLEGAVAAVVVFALMAWLVPRPILWYRVVGVAALLVSLIPDVMLAMGGPTMLSAMRIVGPLASVGSPPPPPRPEGAGGGPPGGFVPTAAPLDQVLILMLLHAATAVVCIALLTTLTRKKEAGTAA
jgi:hypothetical protein